MLIAFILTRNSKPSLFCSVTYWMSAVAVAVSVSPTLLSSGFKHVSQYEFDNKLSFTFEFIKEFLLIKTYLVDSYHGWWRTDCYTVNIERVSSLKLNQVNNRCTQLYCMCGNIKLIFFAYLNVGSNSTRVFGSYNYVFKRFVFILLQWSNGCQQSIRFERILKQKIYIYKYIAFSNIYVSDNECIHYYL